MAGEAGVEMDDAELVPADSGAAPSPTRAQLGVASPFSAR
jgi:hypothetical protein